MLFRSLVTEAGWTITYDKDTGDYLFTSNTSPVIEIYAKNSDGSLSVKSGSTQIQIDSSGQVIASANGGQLKIDSSGQVIASANGGQLKIDSSGQVIASRNGATLTITSLGGMTLTPAPGQAIVLNNGVQNVNNLPVCIFSGALHGTTIGAKA